MKNLTVIGLATATILGLTITAPTQTAQAAVWHHGTPKALRGKWRGKHVSPSVERLHITKSHVYLYSAGPFNLKNVKYQKTGKHAYKVRGYEYTYLNANSTIKMRTKGKHAIQYKGSYPGANWISFIHR